MRAPMRRLVRRPGEPTAPRRATAAFAARVVGSVVGVAGISLMGAGTLGNPAGVFAANNHNSQVVSDFTCASGQECTHASQVPTTANQDGCAGIAGLLNADGLDPSDSYWHFVIPDSQGFEFNGTGFNASFAGANTEFVVTYVQQQKDGGYKGLVVEADGGVTLDWAWAPESAIMDETAEAEGTGAEDSGGSGDFTLSSTCAGDGTTASSSTTSSNTTSSTNQTTSSQTQASTSTQSTTSSSSTPTTTSSGTTSSTSSSSKTTSSGSTTSSSSTSSSSQSSSSSSSTITSNDTSSSQSASSHSSTARTTTVTDPSTSPSSSVSSVTSASNPSTGVLGANTTTPSTGADIEFGLGIALLLGGAGVVIGTTRMRRNKGR